MQLINTIEINPYDFSDEEYERPDRSAAGFANEWNQFWKKCLSDKNLGRLTPIGNGVCLVDIQTINNDELAEILKHKLKDVTLSDFKRQVGPICGGIALRENNTIYLQPTCCGDMGNIGDWGSIFKSGLHQWHQLWIGHPWVYYRRNNGIIEFSGYTESDLKDLKEIDILISVPESDLQIEFDKISAQQNDFQSRIQKVLEEMRIANAKQIATLMTGKA